MISYGSIPNEEDDNRTYDEEKEDRYVNMELGILRKDDDRLMHAIVMRRKMYDKGKAIGTMNNNPLIDTRSYEVEFSYVTTESLGAI